MAKLEEPQSIPSALLDLYRATLNPHPTGNIVKKRYPFRMPRMQEGGKGVHAGQVANRARFKKAVQDFKGVSTAERARWYAAEPPYSSFLWYYNYFIMSSLAGNADISEGGAGVIKSIQYVSKSIPTAGDEAITITTVDPAKTVVMLFGNSFISETVQRGSDTILDGGSNDHTLSPVIDPALSEVKITGYGGYSEADEGGAGGGNWAQPYVSALIAAKLTVAMINTDYALTVGYSWEVIERKSQTVYPYVKTIAAEAITLSWPVEPSVAAVIGAIVIEYI